MIHFIAIKWPIWDFFFFFKDFYIKLRAPVKVSPIYKALLVVENFNLKCS